MTVDPVAGQPRGHHRPRAAARLARLGSPSPPTARRCSTACARRARSGPTQTQYGLVSPVVQQNLQVDATYEFTLDATDACNRTTSSVRLVRLNDATPPSAPLVAGPSFDHGAKSVKLSWVAASDNIQVDHYSILRDGVPLGATDATTFVDASPPQHSDLTYIVRAVDTNGNTTNSAPALIMTPDWTAPTAPVPGRPTVKGTTVTLQWPPAVDNVGVVAYDVFRDDILSPVGTMTAAKRTYQDFKVSPGVHTWRVRSRDEEGLSATSGPVSATVRKAAPVAGARARAAHGRRRQRCRPLLAQGPWPPAR